MDLPVGSDGVASERNAQLTNAHKEVRSMRYLKIVMLLLAVTVGTQACIIPVPIGGGDGGHHHHHNDW
jgi:hypothetical protein